MPERRKYVKRAGTGVVAVQLNLDTEGFVYRKWGDVQRCQPGDWVVDNDGEVYTVNNEAFRRTYQLVRPGFYAKVSVVWAEVSPVAGVIQTKQGLARHQAGAYLVSNDDSGEDRYPVDAETFERLYEPVEP